VAYQINPAHTGVQVDSTLAPPFLRRWRATFPGGVSYPLIAQGMVFVTAADGPPDDSVHTTLYALDQRTGQVVWSQPLPFFRPWANAAYDNGRLFVVGSNPTLCCSDGQGASAPMFAFDAGTGARLWTTRLLGQWVFDTAPTAANGIVYAAGTSAGGTIYAVDEATGQVLARGSDSAGNSSPALSDTALFTGYEGCTGDDVWAHTLSLAPLWHYYTMCEGGSGWAPAYANGRVYARGEHGSTIFDANTGQPLANWTDNYVIALAPAIDQNTLFDLTYSVNGPYVPTLTAKRLSDLSTTWSFSGDGQIDTNTLLLSSAAGEYVVEGSASGMLYVLDAATGTIVWSTDVGAPFGFPGEGFIQQPTTSLGAGQGLLVVPASNTLTAYMPDTRAPGADCNLADYPSSKGVLNLKNANLGGCYLPGANLSGANASNANLAGAYLDGANLSSTTLNQAHLKRAVLTHADLTRAKLALADLTGAQLGGANLTGASWNQTTCPDGTNSNTDGGTCEGHLP
jgi:outer membrane protein assembly factor BamB